MALFRVTGVREVRRAFRELPRVTANKVVRQGLRAGAKLVRARAQEETPVRSGALKKDIKVRAAARRKKGVIAVEVRMGEGDYKGRSFYGAFPEYGTARQKARHFVRRAFRAVKGRAAAESARAIRDGIEREAKALEG